MKRARFVAEIFAAVLVFSCKEAPVNFEDPDLRKIYFESEYVNFAWGYSHFGWFIDTSGNVISYDIAKAGAQWRPNSSGYYSESELWAKIRHRDTLRQTISPDTLQRLREFALASVTGTYSDTTCPGADMGEHFYSCYIFQADSAKFRRVVLQMYGDCRFHNTSPSATEIINWMASK